MTNQMKQWNIKASNLGRVLEFEGELVSKRSSRDQDGEKPRWTEVAAYQTVGGKWIIHIVGRTTYPSEVDLHTATVLPDMEEDTLVQEFFDKYLPASVKGLGESVLEDLGFELETERID